MVEQSSQTRPAKVRFASNGRRGFVAEGQFPRHVADAGAVGGNFRHLPTAEVRDGLLSGVLIASFRRALRLGLFELAPLNEGQFGVQTEGAAFAQIDSESAPGWPMRREQ